MTNLNCDNSLTRLEPYQVSSTSSQVSSRSPTPVHSIAPLLDSKNVASEPPGTFNAGLIATQLMEIGMNSNFLINVIRERLFSNVSDEKDLTLIRNQLKELISAHPQRELTATHKAIMSAALKKLKLEDAFEVLLVKDKIGNHLSSVLIRELLPIGFSLDNVINFLATIVPQYSLQIRKETLDELKEETAAAVESTSERSLHNPTVEDHLSSVDLSQYMGDDSLISFNPLHFRPSPGIRENTDTKAFEIIFHLLDRTISSLGVMTSPEERKILSAQLCQLLQMRDQSGYSLCYLLFENCPKISMKEPFKLICSLFSLLEFKELKATMHTLILNNYPECFFEVLNRKEIWKAILELKVLQERTILRCVTESLPPTVPQVISSIACSYFGEVLNDQLFELLTLRNDQTGNYLFYSLLNSIDFDLKKTTVLPLLHRPNIVGHYVVHHCLMDSMLNPKKIAPTLAPDQVVKALIEGLPLLDALEVLRLKDATGRSVIHHFPARSNWAAESDTLTVEHEVFQRFAVFLSNLCLSIIVYTAIDSKKLADFLNTTGMDSNGNTILGIIINYSHELDVKDFYQNILEMLALLETPDLDVTLTNLIKLRHLKMPIDLLTLCMKNERSAAKILRKTSPEMQERIFKVYPQLREILEKDFDGPIV